jgi:hypothetical protein
MSRFYVLRFRTHFRRYRWRPLPFSCFAFTGTFSAVRRASGPVFMFCAPRLVFGGTEDVRSIFHVLRSRKCFRRYRGRRVPFSCFALPDSFSTEPRSGSILHVLRSRTCFRRYRRRRVLFSCLAIPDSFSAVPIASCPFFMFSAPGLIFGGTEEVGSRFHVLRSRTRF